MLQESIDHVLAFDEELAENGQYAFQGAATVINNETGKVEAIVLSMTSAERQNPSIINASRKQRIAKGSGVQVQQVNRLLKQFEDTKKMMKKLTETNYITAVQRHENGKLGVNDYWLMITRMNPLLPLLSKDAKRSELS